MSTIAYGQDTSAAAADYQKSVWLTASIGLLIATITALLFSHTPLAHIWVSNITADGHAHMNRWPTFLFIGVMFAALFGTFAVSKSAPAVQFSVAAIFYIASGGLLSVYPLIMPNVNLIMPVLAGFLVFGGAALFGHQTTRSLASMGRFCLMGLIAVILMSIIAMVFHLGMLSLAVSVVSVVIFTGLTAADTQRIKAHGEESVGYSTNEYIGQVIGDSMNIYLDLINIIQDMIEIFNR